MKILLNFFTWFSKQSGQFRALRENEETRRNSASFGVKSVLFVIIGCLVSAGIALGGVFMVSTENVVFVILGVLLIVAGALSALNFFVRSLYCAVLQLRLNKKPIGYIAIILCIVLTALILTGIALIANNIF